MGTLVDICAKACRQSYQDDVPGFEVGDLRYTVQETDEMVLIAIRGTANIENAIRDLETIPEKTVEGHWAHGGFTNSTKKLLAAGILNHIAKDRRVVLTGHSLGGAIAVLLAEIIGCELITFGCPRVYTKWGTTPTLNHIRIIRDDDPVPMMPRILYKHDCEPVILCDGDRRLIEVQDHYIDGYIACLNQREGAQHAN